MISLKYLKGYFQYNQEDCGVASLATILNYYGIQTSISKLKSDMDFSKFGVSIQDIIDSAGKFNFVCDAYQSSYEELFEAILKKEITVPLIMHLMEKNNGHFIVLKRITKTKVKIFDPKRGHITLRKRDFLVKWTGVFISFTPPVITSFKKRKVLSNRYLRIILQNKKNLLYYILLSLLATSISLLGTLLYKFIIDDYILSNIGSDNTFRNIVYIFFLLALFYIFQLSILCIRDFGINKISKSISNDLSKNFISHVLNISESKLERFSSGDILSRFESIVQVQGASINMFFTILTESLGVICGGVLLCYLDFRLFMIALVIAFLYMLGFCLVLPYLRKLRREYYTKYSENLTQIRQVLSGKYLINQYGRESWAIQRVLSNVKASNEKLYNIAMISSLSSTVVSFLEVVGMLSIFCFGTFLVFSEQLSLGTLMSSLSIVAIFISPIQKLILVQSDIQNIDILFKRLDDIFDTKVVVGLLSETNKELTGEEFSIVVEDLSYDVDRKTIISHLDLRVGTGEKVLLAGSNGSGKTTLLKIISSIYSPTRGTIKLGNVNYRDLNLSYLKESIDYVGPNPYIFEGTMLDNILLGETLSKNKLQYFLELYDIFELENFSVEDILHLEILEDGRNLSSGQKQKIALIRALLKSPKLLLLDEAFNNIDSSCKEKIITYLKSLKSMAMIVISHDKSIDTLIDTYYYLDDGKLSKISGSDI